MDVIKKDLLPGLFIVFGHDGTWLHFETETRKGAILLEEYAKPSNIAGLSVEAWLDMYRKKLEEGA